MKRALLILVVASLVFLMSAPTYGRDLNVPQDYSSIQRAINAASYGDMVIVSPGTYYEQITMKEGVVVVAEGTDDERSNFITAERTIIDASDGNHHCGGGMRGRGINTVRGADEATIDGFTLTGAFTEDPEEIGPRSGGNGVLCVERRTLRGTSPTIQNCIITDNSRV